MNLLIPPIPIVDLGTKQLRQLVFSIKTAREDFDIARPNIGVLCYNKHFFINTFNVEMSPLDCIWLLAVLVEF